MKILQKICFVLLLTTVSSAYAGDCFVDRDINDCRVKAEQGDGVAQYNLGVLYDRGIGVLQNYKEAIKWWKKAAEQGYVQAQYNLGNMYSDGRGVPQNYKEAIKWYKKSAEQGDSSSQYNLGLMYGRGQGVIQDYVMAHIYFNIAAVISGHKGAIEGRGIVEELMTSSQLAEAQRMAQRVVRFRAAREWMRTHQ